MTEKTVIWVYVNEVRSEESLTYVGQIITANHVKCEMWTRSSTILMRTSPHPLHSLMGIVLGQRSRGSKVIWNQISVAEFIVIILLLQWCHNTGLKLKIVWINAWSFWLYHMTFFSKLNKLNLNKIYFSVFCKSQEPDQYCLLFTLFR